MILGRSERAFIQGALFTRRLDVERLRALSRGGLRWTALAQAAMRAGLAPVVAQAVIEAGVSGQVPSKVLEDLRVVLFQNAAQNSALLALLARIASALQAAKVPALPLKGAALMVRCPSLVPIRTVSDLDLLVSPADVDLATSVLIRQGWSKVTRQVEIDVRGRVLPQGAERLDAAHGVTLRGETGLLIELHHALPSAGGSPRLAGSGIFERAEARHLAGQEVRCPSIDDMLAVACEHVLVHHRDHLIHQPRLVMDLDVMLAAGADPAHARALWGPEVGSAVDEGLMLLEETRRGLVAPSLLGRGRPEQVLSPAWRWARALHWRFRSVVGSPAWLLRAFQAHGMRALFPVRDYMAARYRVSSRSRLFPLLYVWRPLRWLINLVTRR